MYYFLSLLTGILISAMIAFNGGLTQQYGVYSATIIIHIVGLIPLIFLLVANKEKPFSKRYPWFLYMGGAIGVLTTVFNNVVFGRISVSAMLAIGLFGQSVTGIVVDQYGFLGMPKHPFTKRKLIGLSFILAGIAYMITNFEAVAVILSFSAGVSVVTGRTFNAKLADLTSVQTSTFYNYVVGLLVSVLAFLLLGGNEALFPFTISPVWYIYLGGILGVGVVLLSNITVVKVSAFYLTLLIFVGQVFSGILIDAIISQELSARNLIGGVLVGAGLSINLLLDRKK